MTAISGVPRAPAAEAQFINTVELVCAVNNQGSAPKSIPYTTYLAEEDTYPAGNNFNGTYHIPMAVKNCYIMFFSDGALSTEPNLSKYRFTLDNKEICNRAIKVGSPLHKDLIGQVFQNAGEELKCINERQYRTSSVKGANEGGDTCRMIALPVPFVNREQKLGIELEGTGALTGHHVVYYEQVRNL